MTGTGKLVIKGEVSIYRAEELRQLLLDALASHPQGVEIDLSEVTEIDSSGIQLLMAAKRAAQACGGDMTLVEHSMPVLEVLEVLGLASFFGDTLVVRSPESRRKPG